MKYSETTAASCRYGDCARLIFQDTDVIWEDSEADYQGHANVLAYDESRDVFIHYEWTYGSCSGCDGWEAQGFSTEQVVEEMRREAAVIHGVEAAKRYFRMDSLDEEPDEYSRFERAGWALKKWLEERKS